MHTTIKIKNLIIKFGVCMTKWLSRSTKYTSGWGGNITNYETGTNKDQPVTN
jgi:hypothetical protein